MKIKAKTSVEQTVKYALLHRYHQNKHKKEFGSYLLYLTPNSFGKTWKENLNTIQDLKTAIEQFDFESLLLKTKLTEDVTPTELRETSLATNVAHMSYNQLLEYSKKYHDSIEATDKYATTVRKLVHGVICELELRGVLLGIGK